MSTDHDTDFDAGHDTGTITGRALEALRDVYDPEIGLDIVSLGLVYGVHSDATGIDVDMTLTTVGCPVSESLPFEAESAIRLALPDRDVRVRVVWDPPWTPERMSDAALDALGYRRR
jgi:metal-sulfur cluster biosynthetic enzyme